MATSSESKGVAPNRTEPEKTDPIDPKATFCPSFSVCFRFVLLARLTAVLWSPIADCDETFNYWEPVHYLQYGTGLQTWEYAPQYALRSWAYAALHWVVAPTSATLFFVTGHTQVFFAVRLFLAVACALCEARLVRALADHVSGRVARVTLLFLVLSTGMWTAGVALLPSSFAMMASTLAAADALPERLSTTRFIRALLLHSVGALWGWPFSAVLAIPLVLRFAAESHTVKTAAALLLAAAAVGVCVLGPLVALDSAFYGRLTVAPWNLVHYNVLDSKESGGPNLYGSEPWWFYFVNGMLNWALAWPLALAAPLIGSRSSVQAAVGAPLLLWLAIFSAQPHKEERFLYPVYPLIAAAAAAVLNTVKQPRLRRAALVLVAVSAVVSVLRSTALSIYYGAPIRVFMQAESKFARVSNAVVCISDDWYRFPSSYFLPADARLGFVRGSFRGLLPAYYSNDTASATWLWDQRPGIRAPAPTMNDRNLEEPRHYTSPEKCDFIVSMVDHPLLLPLWDNVTSISCERFLDAPRSGRLSRLVYLHDSLASALSGPGPAHGARSWLFSHTWRHFCAFEVHRRPSV